MAFPDTAAPFTVVIPARMGSTRFPGKMLAVLGGQTVLARTFRQACQSRAEQVLIATDHPDIAAEASRIGATAVLTDPSLPSGTDRTAAALAQLPHPPARVVNVQGDEPFIDPAHINAVGEMLAAGAVIATLAIPVQAPEELSNPNTVQVVLGRAGQALYFSRWPIPYPRATGGAADLSVYPYLRHVGIYGFQTEALRAVVALPPSPLELAESLEQLRWLEAGYPVQVRQVAGTGMGIDTPADLAAAEAWLAAQPSLG